MTLTRRKLLAAAGAGTVWAAAPSGLLRPAAAAPIGADRMREVYERVKTPYKYGMVLRPAPGTRVDSPSVFRAGDRWYLMYIVYYDTGRQGYETRLASSTDLLSWTPLGTILPFRDGAWDSEQAAGYVGLQDTTWGGSAELQQRDGRYWLSYIGGNDPGYEAGDLGIGVASTTDPTAARPWDRFDRAVLTPSDADAGGWERGKLYKSNIIVDPDWRFGARYLMYYNATTDGYEQMGLALSDDLVTWRRWPGNPILAVGAIITGDPQVVRIGDLWVMFFFARDSYGRATDTWDSFACSTDLVTWTPWDGEVLLTTTEPVDRQFAHKPWLLEHRGVAYHWYCAIGDEGWGIALATSRDLRRGTNVLNADASYTFIYDSPHEAIDGVVSTQREPGNRWTAYDSPNGSDWLRVQFPYSAYRPVREVRLHIYDDGGGVRPPRDYRVEYWNGARFAPVPGLVRTPATPAAGRNTATFSSVSTDALRIFFDHRGGGAYSGVTEVEVA